MSSKTSSERVGMQALGAMVRDARGDRTRAEVGMRAATIAVRCYGDDNAPWIDEIKVRDVEERMMTPSGDGRILRCVLAAVGIRLVDALAVLQLWPDANVAASRSVAASVAEAMKLVGYPDATFTTSGRQIIITI